MPEEEQTELMSAYYNRGWSHGRSGYDRGCKCDVCMQAMRDHGAKHRKPKVTQDSLHDDTIDALLEVLYA